MHKQRRVGQTLVTRATNNGGEDGTRRIITSEAGFTHTRTVVDDKGLNLRGKGEEKSKGVRRAGWRREQKASQAKGEKGGRKVKKRQGGREAGEREKAAKRRAGTDFFLIIFLRHVVELEWVNKFVFRKTACAVRVLETDAAFAPRIHANDKTLVENPKTGLRLNSEAQRQPTSPVLALLTS
jgi:hypothetical protein